MYKKIVVALDESKEAARALEAAIELAVQVKAELTLVSVCEPLPSYTAFIDSELPGAKQKLIEERNTFYSNLQREGVAKAAGAGLQARGVLVEGDEVQSIVDHIVANGNDLLVLGRRHHHSMSRIWGGTVHNIAEKSRCSILGVY